MKTVAVIFGSRSTEHDVSVVTAISSIIKPLQASGKYQVEPIYISRDGNWYWDSKLADISLYSSGKIDNFLLKASSVALTFDDGLVISKKTGLTNKTVKKRIDVVFPATHGTYGEDGSLMGLLRMANVPYVGCGMDASVIAMDKVLSKQVALINNIRTPKMVWGKKLGSDYIGKLSSQADKELSYPMFVKPAHLGSSIGISKVKHLDELKNSVEVAFHYDDKVLVEESIEDLIEVTLPIIGNETLEEALLERPVNHQEGFFDFESKYLSGGGKKSSDQSKGSQGYSELPAKIDRKLYDDAVKLAKDIYRAVGCEGIARIDMLIDNNKQQIYFNEINPLPGSLYSHNWKASGMSGVELVDKLVDLAIERFNKESDSQKTFDTNYLKQF